MAITLTQLTAFLAVMRGGSVTAAADELVVTQPSVSAAIASLGRELGCDLFERAGRGIRPTAAGAAFEPYAADVIGLLDQGRQAAHEAAAAAARSLRIAAVTTAAESFVPALMRAFAAAHPDVELTLDVGNRQDVLERVLGHSADVAVSGTPPTDERLAAEPLMDNAIVCITAPDDPLIEHPGAGGRGAARARLAAAGARLRHAPAQRALPRRARREPEGPDARLERGDQAGRQGGARGLAAVARDRRGGARVGAAGRAAARRIGPRTGRGSCCGRRSARCARSSRRSSRSSGRT